MSHPKKSKYICESCKYETNNKTNYIKHEITIKHKQNIENEKKLEITREQFHCQNCKIVYNTKSGLWKHTKKCFEICYNKQNIDNILSTEKSQDDNMSAYSDDSIPPNTYMQIKMTDHIPYELVMEVITQNRELKDLLLEQNNRIVKTSNENQEIKSMIREQNHKIVEISNKPNIIQNNTNNFNLNLFLNEKCKDAINIMDFVNNLQIEFSDVEYVGRYGFVEGISKIFMNGLKQLDVYKRPIHCTDLKRETIYIKDENQWYKDTEDKTKIKNYITKVANKNIQRVTQWHTAHPETNIHDSSAYNFHLVIMKQSVGGSSFEQMDKNTEKIMKNIAKHVLIDRNIL